MESESKEGGKKPAILNSAMSLFSKRGYHETTMDQISEEAGVSKGTLYYYFDSKRELFLELFKSWFDQFDRLWKKAMDSGSPEEKLRKLAGFTMKMSEESNELAYLMFEFWVSASRGEEIEEILSNLLQRYRQDTAEIIEEGIQTGTFRPVDPWVTACGLVAAYDGLWFHWIIDPDAFSLAESSKELIDNYLQGLKEVTK